MQGAVASSKDVIVELTSYRPRGTPQHGDPGPVPTGTEESAQAQRRTTSEWGLVRLRKLGLEAGEPAFVSPGVVDPWDSGERSLRAATRTKPCILCGAPAARHVHTAFLTSAVFAPHWEYFLPGLSPHTPT